MNGYCSLKQTGDSRPARPYKGDFMNYDHILSAVFLERPNRFTALVSLPSSSSGKTAVCHVKNTGRCRELLIPGTSVLIEHHSDALQKGRKTEYSLIGVYKERAGRYGETLLINMDSQAPNQAAFEWLCQGGLGPVSDVKREVRFGGSRFDLSFRKDGSFCFMEVKGVTLETNGTASFPDAPTERGLKHLLELEKAVKSGFQAYVLFVIQMKGICAFTPNRGTHPAFADALKRISQNGVQILAKDCLVTEHSMKIDGDVPVFL